MSTARSYVAEPIPPPATSTHCFTAHRASRRLHRARRSALKCISAQSRAQPNPPTQPAPFQNRDGAGIEGEYPMKVKMLTLDAGPEGVRQPGKIYEVAEKEAKELIK